MILVLAKLSMSVAGNSTEKKTDLREIEAKYTNFEVIGQDKVRIEVRMKGK